MANNFFSFKQFTIVQEKSAMKVGTDGVLLGAWAHCENAGNILDIGTGTGVIALMLAQRFGASVDAVEINSEAFHEALQNAQNSPWPERLSMHNMSIQEFSANNTTKYDLIVSNPPYFIASQKAQNAARNVARHNESLSIPDLFNCVHQLLSPLGVFSVIIPSDNYVLFMEQAEIVQLYCTRKLWICPTPAIPAKRVLLAFERTRKNCSESSIVVESEGRHKYSPEYKNMTKDFYLAF